MKNRLIDIVVMLTTAAVLIVFINGCCQWHSDDIFIKEEVINCREMKCEKVLV